MATDITLILEAVKGAVEGAYPGIPVIVKAAGATEGGKAPQPGWTPGTALPCFIVSELAAEKVDEVPSFQNVSLGYPVVVEYCKSAAPKNWADDPDIRDKRIALEDLLYRIGVSGVPASVFDVRFGSLPVYQPNGAGDVVCSGVLLLYTLNHTRPGRAVP